MRDVLFTLEDVFALEFTERVAEVLRRLSDRQINDLYMLSHSDFHCGDYVSARTAVLMPLIDREQELRRDLAVIPRIGPIIAPQLYSEGGAYDLPF